MLCVANRLPISFLAKAPEPALCFQPDANCSILARRRLGANYERKMMGIVHLRHSYWEGLIKAGS